MSRKRWTLTKTEQTEYRKRVERLRAAGADLDVSSFEPSGQDWIEIEFNPVGSCVRVFPGAPRFQISQFQIDARIVALASKVSVRGLELSSSSLELLAFFLDDPMVNGPKNRLYRFPDGTHFHRDEVLNHRLGEDQALRRGDILEGLLLAQSFAPIPDCFADKTFIPICLSIVNQFGDVQTSIIPLPVERSSKGIQLRRSRENSPFEPEEDSIGIRGELEADSQRRPPESNTRQGDWRFAVKG